jgi:hypothetical protein
MRRSAPPIRIGVHAAPHTMEMGGVLILPPLTISRFDWGERDDHRDQC